MLDGTYTYSEAPPPDSGPDEEPREQPRNPERAPDADRDVKEAHVRAELARLDVGFDVEKHPAIVERLARIESHFADSVDIAEIIGLFNDEISRELGIPPERKKELMRAAVLHDIGKSGPAGEITAYHDAIRTLFRPPDEEFHAVGKDGKEKSVGDFIAFQRFTDADALKKTLAENGVDLNEDARFFWRRHAEWTYDILYNEASPDIDRDLAEVAASHHMLEDRNPVTLDFADASETSADAVTFESAEALAVIDKYQAMRRRGMKSHETAIARLRTAVAKKADYPDFLRAKFTAAVNVLERHATELNKMFPPPKEGAR